MDKIYVNNKIAMMLECLLGRDGMTRSKCKTCSHVNACCYLTEAVFVVQHDYYQESRKAKSA
ncbi:MAG: hypothetical protein JSW20_13285 [Nitrospiraceae bacterium]|nr:MAG: hypothetical protein JSW20_13285 [Nitrospiraceae bacterium]